MSDDGDYGFNWSVLIYPAVVLLVVVLVFLRWKMMRKRQLAQIQVVTAQSQNGFSSQDFVVGNPFSMAANAATYGVEQPQPAVHQKNTKEVVTHSSKTVEDETPTMIKTKRWF